MPRALRNAVLIGLAIFVVTCQLATQVVALALDFHPSLGAPFWRFDGWGIYQPFAFFGWRSDAPDRLREVFAWPGLIVLGGAVLGPATTIRMLNDDSFASGFSDGNSWDGDGLKGWLMRITPPALGGLCVFCLFSWAATMLIAWRFNFDPSLGPAAFRLVDMPIYGPLDFFVWEKAGRKDYPIAFGWPWIFIWLGAVCGVSVAVWIDSSGEGRADATPSARRERPGLTISAPGWASTIGLKRAGLLATRAGIVLGGWRGVFGAELITYAGNGHVLALGGTRSGKGRGLVVPTCLNWRGALIALDPKGELADGDLAHDFPGTAGYRATFSSIIRFAPTRTDTVRFNPLLEVRRGENEVRDVQNIVDILTTPVTAGHEAPFWRNAASNLLVGVILDVLHSAPEGKKSLAEVRRRLANMEENAEAMRARRHVKDATGEMVTHPVVKDAASSFLALEDRTQSNVRATAEAYFTLFADPLVARNTAVSDFRLGDLVSLDQPGSLYLQPPPSDVDRLMPLMRIIIAQTLRTLTEARHHDGHGRRKKHRTLLLLDEFPILGQLPGFERMLGLMAGYGVQAMMVCQSLNAIRGVYGRDNVIIDNCDVITSFAVSDPATANVVSAMAGERWAAVLQPSRHQGPRMFEPVRRSMTLREERRPLILPGDVLRLPADQMLIFKSDCAPVRAAKIQFDRVRLFQDRLLAAPDAAAAANPSPNDWEQPKPGASARNVTPMVLALPAPRAPSPPKPPGPARRTKGI